MNKLKLSALGCSALFAIAACGGAEQAQAESDVELKMSYAEKCIERGGDETVCNCLGDAYKSELNDDLYAILTLNFVGDTDAASKLTSEYISSDPDAAATMGSALSAATEKASEKCG